jgi:hypothetical protein
MLKTLASVSLFFFLTSGVVQAAVITINGTIKSVDAKKRTITVKTKTKTLELDVSRKAKVSVKGKTAKLDSLTPGQKVTIAYHEGLEIVLKIEASGRKPQIFDLSEINTDGFEWHPWLSPDGLTIHWDANVAGEKDKWIWTAKRKNSDSMFDGKKRIMKGRWPTLTPDGLQLFLLRPTPSGKRTPKGRPVETLHMATRATLDDSFQRPREISQLALSGGKVLLDPSLSFDGLTLYFVLKNIDTFVLHSTRRTAFNAPWQTPKPLKIDLKAISEGIVSSPFVTSDSMFLLCSHELRKGYRWGTGGILVWRRSSATASFADPIYLKVPGIIDLYGVSPRYVAATNELFFVSTRPNNDNDWDLWLIKNFDPLKLTK